MFINSKIRLIDLPITLRERARRNGERCGSLKFKKFGIYCELIAAFGWMIDSADDEHYTLWYNLYKGDRSDLKLYKLGGDEE